jgi:probable HAF family extracellular repeat protein
MDSKDRYRATAYGVICAGIAYSMQVSGLAGAADTTPAARSGALPATYSVVNLGLGWPTEGPKINNRGQVAFSVRNETGYRALFYDGQSIRDLGNLGGNESYALALNDTGEVVGRSRYNGSDAFDQFHAFRWTSTTGMVDLGSLPQTAYATASAVNNLGDIAGTSNYSGRLIEPSHAVRWPRGGPIVDLGTLYGASGAAAINDAGQIAGNVEVASYNSHAFFWTAARGMMDLGSLGGQSETFDMNASGQIVGDAEVGAAREWHAFSWSPRRHMVDLGTLGGNRSHAFDVNDRGDVVGFSTTASGREHAFVWNDSGRMRDLGTFGGTDARALQINDYGLAVGQAMLPNQTFHAFAWTARGGMVDLNHRLRRKPLGLVLDLALGVADDGTIVASSNAGLVVLKPGGGGPAAPVVGPIVNAASARSGTSFTAIRHFFDTDTGDTHQATWTWGDGSKPERAVLSERNGSGTVRATHTYREPGDYLVVTTVTDSTGRQASAATLLTVCVPAPSRSCGP